MKNRALFLGIGLLALGACSTTNPGMFDYGKPKLVDSNGPMPSWVDAPGRYARDHTDRKYFVGVDSRCTLYDVCRDVSRGNALKTAAEAIRDKVHSLLEVASTDDSNLGTPDVERAIESGTLQTAYGVLHGATVDRYFWQKFEVQNGPYERLQYYRNVYALVSMSNDDWKASVYETLTKQATEVHDPRARALLKKMEDRWLNKKQ